MFTTVLSWLGQSISFCYNIFVSFVSDSLLSLFFSMFMVLLVYRLIIKPIIGGSLGSDKVRKRGKSEDE